ncbi:GNAT family N-acetyltransferase [Candidatus Methylospira mobilis]|uniref:GNAT family N-acetyltransferase n=1 Tax=Candidatus Methylospira mobilis TaxID=1808979 RepID=A0A5Q0BQD9_9GAMM|nr:GNAT family N-acetyltransferase [Candidatus Methylospira mobilis]QFY44297.1 GNAT family N-acetyltransferase [Candidatus Methylospira mobilis]
MTHPNPGFQILLESAKQQDIPVLLPLVRQFYHHFGYPYHEAQKTDALMHFIQDESRGRLLIVKNNGNAIGYVLIAFCFSLEFDGVIAFVDELFIEPSSRQKRAGSQVLEQVEKLCGSLGMKAVRLESEADNSRATALYARTGYHDHKRRLMTKRFN